MDQSLYSRSVSILLFVPDLLFLPAFCFQLHLDPAPKPRLKEPSLLLFTVCSYFLFSQPQHGGPPQALVRSDACPKQITFL